MRVEEIIVLFLVLITILVIAVLAYQVCKYFNNKSLGQQTILDEIVKDFFFVLLSILIFGWITWIKVVSKYNHYVALTLMKIELAFRVCLIAQGMVFWIVRYALVFHFAAISYFDEKTIKIASRTIVAILALLFTIFEDVTKSVKFEYLTKDHIAKNFNPQGLEFVPILSSLTAIIIVFVQGRISYLRWKNPLPQPPIQDENNDTYDGKIVTAVCALTLIVSTVFRILGYFISIAVLGNLIIFLCFSSYLFIAIVALIYSNTRMFIFVKNNLFTQNVPIGPEPVIPQHDNSNEEPIQDQPNQELNQNALAVPFSQNQNPLNSYPPPQPQPTNTLPDVSV